MRIAVIGTNFITDRFLEAAALHGEFTLAAVCGSSQSKAELFASKHGNVPAYGDYRQLAERGDIDGVYIASPNQLHHPMTMFFLEAGMPVLCEKPLAPNLRQAEEMVELSRSKNTLLIEAIVPMFIPNFRQLRDCLPRLGAVRQACMSFCQYSSRYDSYREGVVQNAFKSEYMGGSLLDIGIYPLYHAMALFGVPERVTASANLLTGGVDGSGAVILGYNGMEAVILHSKVSNTLLKNEIQGEDGCLVYNSGSNPVSIQLCPRGGQPKDVTLPQREERMYYELDEFIRCIKSGEQQSTLAPHSQSLAVYRVADEVRRQTGVCFSIDR